LTCTGAGGDGVGATTVDSIESGSLRAEEAIVKGYSITTLVAIAVAGTAKRRVVETVVEVLTVTRFIVVEMLILGELVATVSAVMRLVLR
jgi:hypothetical protein